MEKTTEDDGKNDEKRRKNYELSRNPGAGFLTGRFFCQRPYCKSGARGLCGGRGRASPAPAEKKWRKDFPLLNTKTAENKPLVYLDSAATSQKPQAVIDCVTKFYEKENANVHRGIYQLSETATAAYEKSREIIAEFIGSQYAKQLVLTHGATESINLVAHSYFRDRLKPGDEIILSIMEHHANMVPWHILAQEKSLKIHYIPMLEDGSLDEKAYEELLNEKTQLVAITHVSNVLGSINDVEKITKMAHAYQAKVLVDGAQACPQIQVDVDKIGCDFYIGSSHKSYAPTGVGFLYAKPDLLESMVPYQTGGSMIETVTTGGSTFMPPPMRFEAGTPPIAETIAWARACEYLNHHDYAQRLAYKVLLKDYLLDGLKQFLQVDRQFSQRRMDNAIDKLKEAGLVRESGQTSLFSF